ncbi:Variant-specific surface protein, partial [Giardia duodenalis]
VAASQLWCIYSSSNMDLHPTLGGCYDTRAAPGSGVCREARGGACVRYAEENSVDGGRHGTQSSRAHGSTEGVERVRKATCADNTNKCQTCKVQIGDSLYCSQCKTETANIAPVNGICKDVSSDTALCKTNAGGKCTQCDGQSFMYQGGCYQTGDPNLGNTLCTAASNGKCTQAAAGYFVPPGADNTHQSVVSCGDAANGVTLGDNKKYVGVADCAKCNAPRSLSAAGTATATCTECAAGFLHTPTGSTSCVSKCPEGYFEHTDSNTQKKTCQSCSGENTGLTPAGVGVAGCAACTYDSNKVTCTKCGTGKYLKSDGTCADSCAPNTEFVKNDPSNGNKCVSCGTVADGGIENCGECSLLPSASRAGAILITCTKCSTNNLSPLKNECMASCPAGTYAKDKVCTPCHTSCSSCSDAAESSCTACYPGSVLSKGADNTKGTCIPECTGRYAENCEAGMCTAVLGGSKYCSRCKSGFVPVDGLCVSATARAPTGCTPGDGVCSSCTGTYFLQSGGCYNTQTLPGSSVCTAVTGNNGQCTTCANGQAPNNGVCPACPAGCSTCSSSSTCTACLAGYYLSSSKCVKCDTDDSNIKGVPNCVSCAAPTSNTGTVTCYVTQEPTVDPTDPSVNKGGLSSGAIAGISVAVIAVVGGLVGFLCWWFVCRGKA